jgi:hypothetical protein
MATDTDDYASLGPKMRCRMDDAEMSLAKVRDWVALAAETSLEANLAAAYLCLMLGWTRPKPWPKEAPGGY